MKLYKSPQKFLTLVAALFLIGLVFSILSMAVQSHTPTYDSYGNPMTEQTTILPDGTKWHLESKKYGWPVAYYYAACTGMSDECRWGRWVDWPAVVANALVWFALAVVAWLAYFYVTSTTGQRAKGKRKRR